MIFCLTGCGETEHKFFDFTCDYAIDVKLDPDSRSLAYTTQAHVKNNGQDGAEELYFHLCGNFYQTEDECIEVISASDEEGRAVPFVMKDDDQLILLTLENNLEKGEEMTLNFTCAAAIPEMRDIYGMAQDGEIQMAWFLPPLQTMFTWRGRLEIQKYLDISIPDFTVDLRWKTQWKTPRLRWIITIAFIWSTLTKHFA
jgi:hypothetical protein